MINLELIKQQINEVEMIVDGFRREDPVLKIKIIFISTSKQNHN